MRIIELQGERIQLRLIHPGDLDDIHRLHALPETDRYNTLGLPEDIAQTEGIVNEWVAEHGKDVVFKYTFAVKQGVKFLGLAALWLGSPKYRMGEVWYKLMPELWGNGYATEAVKCLLAFGFGELGLHRIEAGCAVENVASARVLEKVGMQLEGRKRKVLPLAEGWSDSLSFGLLAEEYMAD